MNISKTSSVYRKNVAEQQITEMLPPDLVERPRRLPVSAIAYRTQLQDVKMAACFTIKNPEDAAIFVTGLSASSSWPCPGPRTDGPQTPSTTTLHNRRHSERQLSSGYRPVLAVTRRSLPTVDTTHQTVQLPGNQDGKTFPSDHSFRELRNGSFKHNATSTIGRPAPPYDLLKSKSSLISRDSSTKSQSSLNFLSKSKVDLRTGFMRSLSRPTPGELDLKYHRDLQERRRWEKDGEPDLDKLNMADIMRMLKSKSSVQKRVSFQDTTPTPKDDDFQKCTKPQETDSNGSIAAKSDSVHEESPKEKSKAPHYMHEIPCEPPLVSSKHKNKDHKHRLQALYSQYHKYGMEDATSHEISTQGRTSRDHDRKVVEKMARRPSRSADYESRMRVNILSLESFGNEAGDFLGDDFQTSSSESCSEQSSWSGSGGERHTQCPKCRRAQSGKRTSTTRRVRYAEPVLAPSPGEHSNRGRVGQTGNDFHEDSVPYHDLEPYHYKIPFTEYISISHPMRPPANSPVSVLSEDEDDDYLLNMHERQSDQWSLSYATKRAPTRASSTSGYLKGQVKVESHGANKATIDIFLPQMT